MHMWVDAIRDPKNSFLEGNKYHPHIPVPENI